MRVIIFSGTPGTGKTTLAKRFAEEMNFEYVDVKEIIEIIKEEYDSERDCDVVDEEKLVEKLKEKIDNAERDLVIDSHMAHGLPADKVDLCIITKTGLKRLESRLSDRGYSGEKIRENLDAEIFDVCKTEAEEKGHKVYIIDTTEENVEENLARVISQL